MLRNKVPYTIRLLLPILWYGLIFYLTEMPDASSSSTQAVIIDLLTKAENKINLPETWLSNPEFWNGVFRVGAHVFMFGTLGILVYFLIEPTFKYQKAKFWTCILLVFILGALDEVHQSFVPGRFAMPIDVLKDVIGAIIFVSLACFIAKKISAKSSLRLQSS